MRARANAKVITATPAGYIMAASVAIAGVI
jgi:hypothetical protein